jgi:hypothetical protein
MPLAGYREPVKVLQPTGIPVNKTRISEPAIPGTMGKSLISGPESMNRKHPIQAPTKAATMERMMLWERFSPINAPPIKPVIMAIMILTGKAIRLRAHHSSVRFIWYNCIT